ncbi:tyrosine-type recombinase/integrase [Cytobacillus sp. NCCP-133]|uniref:tyrosine-type recombinase/integrase n=1 Tax=Cytobacillus sp. NCCP-133 TaxID=766848 RepID=UPI00222E2881|nr:tyrosine-type recombinase/integrase [Cytobacillus sp. NCCP-133]GLB61990.1 hypothetical protein NCCP133_41190 [Cytobacillus sp. NCCP-133]
MAWLTKIYSNWMRRSNNPKLINVLTPEELKALLDSPDQRQYSSFRDYIALLVMIDTMARVSEVLSLTINELDLNAREVVFNSEITKTLQGF